MFQTNMRAAAMNATALSPLARKDRGDRDAIANPDDLKGVIEEIGAAFEAFKKDNDARLKALEKKGSADVVTLEKVDRINGELTRLSELKSEMERVKQVLDEISAKASRPRAGGETAEQAEHHKAFNRFLRRGDDAGLSDLQKKALSIGVDGDGGYAVPEQLDRDIHSLLVEVSPVRSVARTITVGTSDYKKLVNTRGTASGWVDETAARPETGTPSLAQVIPPIGEVYANPAATQTMLDDVFFDAEGWLAEEVKTEFARQEGIAFVAGDGANKPKGFLTYATAATGDSARAFGTIQYVPTGAAADFAATDAADVLIDLFYAMKAGHRQRASWAMNSETVGRVRKFKDGDGNYLWRPGLAEGQPETVLGRPLVTMEDMPAVAADALAVALANWQAAYYIIDRMGTRVLRDPFTNKPFVHFYTTKRVGGAVVDTEAIKFIKIAAA